MPILVLLSVQLAFAEPEVQPAVEGAAAAPAQGEPDEAAVLAAIRLWQAEERLSALQTLSWRLQLDHALAGAASAAPAAPAAPSPADAEPDVLALIRDAARRWGLDEQLMLRIARCESELNPKAAGPAGQLGLFQFSPATWRWASVAAGLADASPLDTRANVEAAAWLLATDGPHHWGCR